MDSKTLKKKIGDFLKKTGSLVKTVAKHDTEFFEAYCFASVGQFYTDRGYTLRPAQTLGRLFTFQYSTKSLPWNHSYLEVLNSDDEPVCEIRHNQSVASRWAYPHAKYKRSKVESYVPQYQSDIAIVKPGVLPTSRPTTDVDLKKCVANDDLITFAEVKRMIATPMMIASFQGIIYMIYPEFVVERWYNDRRKRTKTYMKDNRHPYPVLFTIGNFSHNVNKVYETMLKSQKAHISVVPDALKLTLKDLAKQQQYEL